MGFADWLKGAKEGLKDGLSRFNNRNFMDATMAGCALIAAANGSIDPEEKQKTAQFIQLNDALKVFDLNTCIERFNEFAAQLEFDHGVGQEECLKAIDKIAGDVDRCRMLVRVCSAIGAADGDFDDDEKAMVRTVCGRLSLDPSDFGL